MITKRAIMPEATGRRRVRNILWWLALFIAFTALFAMHYQLNN